MHTSAALMRMLILKRYASSTVINHMHSTDSASTAFFYCARSNAEPARARPIEILCALLRQLCTSTSNLLVEGPVVTEFEHRSKEAERHGFATKRLTLEDCTRLIIESTKDRPANITVDALDECEEDTRHELLEAFDHILNCSVKTVRIFGSSRDDVDIVSIIH